MNIGDHVRINDPRYRDVKLIVSGINCQRITVLREDRHGRIWFCYVDMCELEVIA